MCAKAFLGVEGFCPDCGCILPILSPIGRIECFACKHVFEPEVLGKMESTYTIWFNSRKTKEDGAKRRKKAKKGEADGPIVERKCIKCGNDKMSYSTLQLRSADEGQTVFYTCTKCYHKETENS